MDEPHLFEGPPDALHVALALTEPTGWRLRIAGHREGDAGWQVDDYEDLTALEALDVVAVAWHTFLIDRS